MQKMSVVGFAVDRWRWLARAGACAGLTIACAQCSQLGPACSTADESSILDRYVEGTVENGVFMSSAWNGGWLAFPGGKRYDIEHKLGCAPREIDIWESFSEQGVSTGSIAPCAGNMCIVQLIDDKVIRIKNDTCSDFFVLVTASGPDCADAGAPDASGDAAGLEASADAAPEEPAQ